MSDKTKTTYSCNLGFLSLLGLAFIILKLTHVIDWSWWFVLMPIYLPAAIGIMISVILIILIIWSNS